MQTENMEEAEAGRAMVRALLIVPCSDAGLQRARGQSVAQLEVVIERLVTRLVYMRPDNLCTLAECLISHAAMPGPQLGIWPAEVLIISWAEALQPRPFRLHRVVTSWLASIEGPQAEAGGWLVPLYRFLREHRRPVTSFDMAKIKEQARADNRQLGIVAEWAAAGVIKPMHQAWHAAWLADQQEARGYVDRGMAARSAAIAKASSEGDEAAA